MKVTRGRFTEPMPPPPIPPAQSFPKSAQFDHELSWDMAQHEVQPPRRRSTYVGLITCARLLPIGEKLRGIQPVVLDIVP